MLLRPESFLPLFFSFLFCFLSFLPSLLSFVFFFFFQQTPCYSFPHFTSGICAYKKSRESFFWVSKWREKERAKSEKRDLSHFFRREKSDRRSFLSLSLSLSFSFSSFSLHTPAADIFLPLMPPAALSAPTRGDAGPARGGGGSNQGRNANTNNAAAANANAPPPEEPLADGGILPRDAALIKGLLRSMVR